MPGLASLRRRRTVDIWPGFVDALATLILVITFVLVVFVLAQFYLRATLSGQSEALEQLTLRVSELSELLSLERAESEKVRAELAQLSTELQSTLSEREELAAQVSGLRAEAEASKEELSEARAELESLNRDIETLREVRAELESEVGQLSASLSETEEALGAERDRTKELQARLATAEERTQLAQTEIEEKDVLLRERLTELEDAQKLTAEQRAQIEVLNRQVSALREQLASLQEALDIAEKTAKEQKVQIADLGRKLNVALASKVQELAKYRSEFFGRLREVLGNRSDVRIVGDRFVFQSEVLFDTGSAELGADGKTQLAELAKTLLQIAEQIPSDLDWILRVDGHTDVRPISTAEFPSNWELSTERALSVVRFLISQGVPPKRLVAAGFGQFQPLDARDDEVAYRRNRRIELKLTEH